MAFRKTLAHRLFNITKISNPNASFFKKLQSPPPPPPPDLAEGGFIRRWLQKRAVFNSAVRPECLSLPVGDKLIERLRSLNGDRLRWEGLAPPPEVAAPPISSEKISVDDVKKLMRVSQLEAVKGVLRGVSKSCVSYEEFLEIIAGGVAGGDREEVAGIARMLDDSGVVIVLGNVVFLRPDQIVKAVEKAIPMPVMREKDDPRREELEWMEKEKKAIDERAKALVRRELWCGLGLLMAQTVGFMRLTFWELSWDVMEPICFYVTSVYFMAGYAFFLRTSKDPSFEGYFESRFSARQKRLMKLRNFDVDRFNELQHALYPSKTTDSWSSSYSPPCNCCPHREFASAMHH